jgi:sucrose phosphorylase
VGCNDDAYLTSRTIQFFTPGIPQVYYVGLLAGENDIDLVEKTMLGRNINRHNFSLEEVKEYVEKPVVKRLITLMKFRNSYPAFNGIFTVEESEEHELNLKWKHKKYEAVAYIDLNGFKTHITYTDPVALRTVDFFV